MKKSIFILISLLVSSLVFAQHITKAINPNVKTLQVKVTGGDVFAVPVIELNSDQTISISFDELTHQVLNLSYKIQHCNADWNVSDLMFMEWGDGYDEHSIDDAAISINTTYNYTHYKVSFPNEDTKFKLSGNYVVTVYNDYDYTKPYATACFSVVDTKVGVEASTTGITTKEINGAYQQLDFNILHGAYAINDPSSEIKVTVMQNNRLDNRQQNVQPSYISNGKLEYKNHPSLIFEGGNEYLTFDMSSVYTFGRGISKIHFIQPYYHVDLLKDVISPKAPYQNNQDANGNYVVNIQQYDEDDTYADYFLVHFTLPTANPFFDGRVYILTDANNNQLTVPMNYDTKLVAYEQTILLKQGGYSYQYLFKPKSEPATTQRISGSHWETENQYAIYVYQRPFGERYDKLIAVKVIQSGR